MTSTPFISGLTIWSPNINIFRDPRWGRGQETYGEDTLSDRLRLAPAFVKGLQGNDPKYYRTIATPKHYAVHSGPESTRHKANIDPSAHDLWDTYLPAFRSTIVEGRADSIMCAYNAVDGNQPAPATFCSKIFFAVTGSSKVLSRQTAGLLMTSMRLPPIAPALMPSTLQPTASAQAPTQTAARPTPIL